MSNLKTDADVVREYYVGCDAVRADLVTLLSDDIGPYYSRFA